jgi:hypothetical protein
VVAARAGSAPELVADGRTGVLVPVDDAAALATAVSSLLADPDRAAQLGRAGLERAQAQFSVARMTERTMAIYASVCENPPMGIMDKIKGWFSGDDAAARDERGADTAASNEPHGETSGDITGKATDTEVARSVGETNPADAERLSDPDAP